MQYPGSMVDAIFLCLNILLYSRLAKSDVEVCHGLCFCSSQEAVVDCSPQDRVKRIPTSLPIGTKKLIIQGGVFPFPGHLTSKNFTGLDQLVSLKIVNSQICSIESDALLDMKNLRHLDLSLNQLQRLERNSFNGLQLTHLYLQEQNSQNDGLRSGFKDTQFKQTELQLADDVFNGLSAKQINLFHNGITQIQFSLFSKVKKLEKLILSSNKLTKLDHKFSEYFDQPDRLLDLTDNPLVCSCSLAWLADRVKNWILKLPSLNVTCFASEMSTRLESEFPGNLQQPVSIELMKLSASHLCTSSRIHSLDVELFPASASARIRCTAQSYNALQGAETDLLGKRTNLLTQLHKPPVAWKYVESGQLRQVSWMPATSTQLEEAPARDVTNNAMATVELNVTLTDFAKELTCITWDERGNNQDLLFTIHGVDLYKPSLLHKKKSKQDDILSEEAVYSNAAREQTYNSRADSEMNVEKESYQISFIYRKQYTVLELLCAIVGTFMTTILILIIGLKCLKSRKSMFSQNASKLVLVDAKNVSKLNNSLRITENPNHPKAYDPKGQISNNTHFDLRHSETNHLLANGYERNQSSSPQLYTQYHPFLSQTMLANYPQYIPPAAWTASMKYRPLLPESISSNITNPTVQNSQMAFNPMASDSIPLNGQPVAFWSAATGSLYSATGSQVYDVPRSMEVSQMTSFTPVGPNSTNSDSNRQVYDHITPKPNS